MNEDKYIIGYIDKFRKETGWTIFMPVFENKQGDLFIQNIDKLTGEIVEFELIDSSHDIEYLDNQIAFSPNKKGLFLERKDGIHIIYYPDFLDKLINIFKNDDYDKKSLEEVQFILEVSYFLKYPKLINKFKNNFIKLFKQEREVDIEVQDSGYVNINNDTILKKKVIDFYYKLNEKFNGEYFDIEDNRIGMYCGFEVKEINDIKKQFKFSNIEYIEYLHGWSGNVNSIFAAFFGESSEDIHKMEVKGVVEETTGSSEPCYIKNIDA